MKPQSLSTSPERRGSTDFGIIKYLLSNISTEARTITASLSVLFPVAETNCGFSPSVESPKTQIGGEEYHYPQASLACPNLSLLF